MTISIYEISVPVYIKNLENFSNILKKTQTHLKNKKIDEQVLVNARLFADMLPLSKQIQIACDFAKASCARLASVEIPSFPDNEKTFDEFLERIEKTIKFLKTFKAEDFASSAEKKISYSAHGMDFNFIGRDYLLNFALPNFYFHFVTAYSILRNQGVELGKADYIGKI
ncbi:MAG: DUF1993 domain-containing protein [Rickettsiales bacterium]